MEFKKRKLSAEMMSHASSSSSITRLSQGYDVFMSFRGEDTRTGFTSHLYDALIRKHIRTYKDDRSLEIGGFVAPELLEAIEASKFAIVILSSNYATSKWCLEEIAKVVDRMERGKLIVIPVFYHVTPSSVRHQSDCFAQGFADHETNPEITPQKVKTWRAAFARVGDIAGSQVTPHRDEAEVVNKIVRRIFKELQDTLPADVPNGLVGIESRVNEVKRILSVKPSEVRFIGICGMSGMGKTTLAEIVFKSIQRGFHRSSFIENIKDVSKKDDSTKLCNLQQKLLNDTLEDKTDVKSVAHGQTLLGTMLRCLKVIIVLDDVNHVDQLTYLAGAREWFGPGTRIIITTTNTHLLGPHIIDEIYTCEELKGDEAHRLFCQSAFKQAGVTHGYEKLTADVVKLAGGLPLALNVYGSILCGKEEKYWNSMLKKLEEYPHEEVLGRLETVYARLDRDQRKTFIYIACFMKGRNIHLVEDILTNIGVYPECVIPDLINMFLITIDSDDTVWMHDLLQQMCWEVLRKESERRDGKHIAIKYLQDILSLEPEETRTIEIINQESYKDEEVDFFYNYSCLSKMMKLKFLRIYKIHGQQGLDRLSNDLRILEWYGCSLKSLHKMFNPKHIFEIEMCYSQLETLWEKELELHNLRSINLSFSKNLTKIPDLTSTLNLVKLNLEGCTKLTELHESVLVQKRLQYLNLKDCTLLQSLGRNTMEMESLEALVLSCCSSLENIPEFGRNMKRLEHLYVNGTKIKKLPENIGEMCSLRKLDASETAIEEIPSSIHYLKSLRLVCVNKCRLSSQIGGFLYTNLDTVSFIRELDLSYCNLSAVPDGIGLLYHLVNLNLSGNDFVSLPESISLLSNLRMLYLNNCKRMQLLPKLSIVNEDTLYGLQIRFSYYISTEGVDVTEFHATSNNSGPTISCLNCPKLAENERGDCLAEKILNSYLQFRTKYWMTPEAVFEIVGARRKLPLGFKLIRPGEELIIEGPWIGVAISAVIDAYSEADKHKYVVTCHIHLGEKHWKISVPVVHGLENQLLFYWTVVDDLHRTVDSSQRNSFCFSFSQEPGDGDLEVTEFGVRVIRDEDIQQLKHHEYTTSEAVYKLFQDSLFLATDLKWYIRACEVGTNLNPCHSVIHDFTTKMIHFILDYGKQRSSLDGLQNIIKTLIEINQQALNECMEEGSHTQTQLFPLVHGYYRIIHATSELYIDFVRLLKHVSDTWLGVKLALNQIVVKCRNHDYTYQEMLRQINDLEAAETVKVSDKFIASFAYILKETIVFFGQLNEGNSKFKSVITLAKVSSITIAGIFSVLATYIGDYELMQELKTITSYSLWLNYILSFSRKRGKWFRERGRRYDRRLQILDFYDNMDILRELKNKMTQFSCATEEEMAVIVIDKHAKKINSFSKTVENMSHDAHKYSHDIRNAGITWNQLIADSKLQVISTGVRSIRDEDILQWKLLEDSMKKAMVILYEATLSLEKDQEWYIRACDEADNTNSIIKFIIDYPKQFNPLDSIFRFIKRVLAINHERVHWVLSECRGCLFLDDLVFECYDIMCSASHLYEDFVRSLKGCRDGWLSVKSSFEQIVVKSNTYEEMLQQVNDFEASENVIFSDKCFISFANVCKATTAFFRIFDQGTEEFNLILAKISSGIVVGVLSVMTMCMVESESLQDLTLNSIWLHLKRYISSKNDEWFKEIGWHVKGSYNGKLKIWESYNNVILIRNLKKKMCWFNCKESIEEEMMVVIDKIDKNIRSFSETIQDMSVHAEEYTHHISKVGITLKIRDR